MFAKLLLKKEIVKLAQLCEKKILKITKVENKHIQNEFFVIK